MKRIFTMLLIVCSAITTASADPTAAAPQKKPENVIRIMNTLIDRFGAKERQIYSVNRNPNTGIIESSIRAVTFYCDAIFLMLIISVLVTYWVIFVLMLNGN